MTGQRTDLLPPHRGALVELLWHEGAAAVAMVTSQSPQPHPAPSACRPTAIKDKIKRDLLFHFFYLFC